MQTTAHENAIRSDQANLIVSAKANLKLLEHATGTKAASCSDPIVGPARLIRLFGCASSKSKNLPLFHSLLLKFDRRFRLLWRLYAEPVKNNYHHDDEQPSVCLSAEKVVEKLQRIG